ncbi:16S rRNA methyltransferase [Rhodanobacter sp. FW510-R12]|uniref:class I SAM-dependent methyltransferase n=1 Tax=unclassified Rhodanobacter TaxID=2621553 RepID=UPI0007AA1152|nr:MULTISPECIES: class I SAM-dependent methyltransferase [unclassified Rhodanobacter]KZC17076.1 16S rRNA methyltransferase [Rhodanobacter sp. FW104-R8]KZC28601.1 16S rRNA methyltransferase [Rhodanobacter sp. FW510-T8]KZC32298.1 16S rRNA methyltransferase [Rhodanobacter sp. FW510-R10]
MTAAGFSAAAPDAALAALFVPFETGELALPADGRVVFLRARAGVRLREMAQPGWLCEQSFLPFADELGRNGLRVGEPAADEKFPLVLLLPPRQRDEARALFARALWHLAPGGTVLAAMPNAEGVKSGEADLARLAGAVQHLSKHKCRAFWSTPQPADVDQGLLAEWLALDEPRSIVEGYISRPGLFAWDRIDRASALLAEHLPRDLHGRVADLGAGYGYLSTQVVARCPRVVAIDLYEAEARALEPARCNLARAQRECARAVAVTVRWHDVTRGLAQRYDAIVSNPPFHQGRADLPELGRAFIVSAAEALLPGGRLLIVANRHLPYEDVLAARFHEVRTLVVQEGFKVIEATGVRG